MLSIPQAGNTELFRKKAFAYWYTFNTYDLDAVTALFEPSYLSEKELDLRRDLRLLKLFRVTLHVEELVPPFQNDQGEWEMLFLLEEPTGQRVIRMAWVQSGGQWLISETDEVKDYPGFTELPN